MEEYVYETKGLEVEPHDIIKRIEDATGHIRNGYPQEALAELLILVADIRVHEVIRSQEQQS